MFIAHINLAAGYRGGERQTELLARCLAGRAIRQRLVVRAGASLQRRLDSLENAEVVPVGWPHQLHAGRVAGTDLSHAHEGRGVHLAARAHRRFGIPYVITRRIEKAPRNDPWTRAAYRGAACIVGVSEAVAGLLRAYVPGAPVAVVRSTRSDLPSNARVAASIRARHAGRFLLGCVAALDDRQKGLSFLIDAMRAVAGAAPDVHLLLIGDGPDRARLEERARGLAGVTFCGFVENVGDYFAAMDGFVLPSLMEGTPGVLLDAMGFGVPVIATQIGGVIDVVEPGAGILVPPADAGALAAAILRMRSDPALRAALAREGRARAEASTPARMTDAYVEIYRRVLSGG